MSAESVRTHRVRLVDGGNPATGRRWICRDCHVGWNSNVDRDVIERQPCDGGMW